MEVILLENIENLGARGQILKVADGYGRNYLLPRKLAVAATPQNRKWVEQQRVKFLKLEAKEKADAEELAKLMQSVEIVMTRRSGEKGQLFGSVTAMDIEEALAAQGFKIERRKIQLDNPLKALGEFDVPIKLHREVTINVKVKVESELEPGQAAPAEPEAEEATPEAEKSSPEAS
ncbi:MAG: 50S ribosomal protein L9 [Acidobacteria bacterium]|nr:50S ribosomal protein L9 [Acidobacteriota bacterium]